MRLPDFEAWAIFATVARLGSFTAAATELGLAKATVSKAVTRLEGELGVALFHRTSRRISLSSAGQSLLPHAEKIRAQGDAATEAARDEAEILTGRVKMAAPLSFGLSELGPVLADFMEEYPGIEIDLDLRDSRVDLTGQGIDLALRIAALPDSSLRVMHLREVRRHLVAAPSYLARAGRLNTPADLKSHRCFIYSNLPNPQVMTFTGPDGDAVSVQPQSVFRANNSDIMLPALIAGQGIAELPDFMCEAALASGGLEIILPAWRNSPLTLSLVMPPSHYRPARVQVLIDFLQKAFRLA
ncbi:LysR family transcriptional regulator [Sphingorhabdus sp. Alg239-R122]|uniref:LysR family transcriptional regulator n=1 Tax=Sphingorhabdus sp. Alg239-R122 TaxID=2305989 RepID=UPI0013DD4799|nr:LysR family transcriptional regulator [Sphingorhabdus sp. Alg239-R122]